MAPSDTEVVEALADGGGEHELVAGGEHVGGLLSEPPGGEIYETMDGICRFEVTRIDDPVLWGWRPETCAYHEKFAWTSEKS